MRCLHKILLLFFVFLPLNVFAIDAEYIEFSPFTGQLDATRTTSGIIEDLDPIYLRRDGTNHMTGPLCFDDDLNTCFSLSGDILTLTVHGDTRQTWTTVQVADNLLLETGDFFLLETGDKLQLE